MRASRASVSWAPSSTLAEAGYRFPRVAGTSAGAVVGAYVVALQRAGEPLSRLEDIARSLNYAKMRDRGVVGRAAGPLARVVDGLSLAFDGGVFEGDYLRAWVAGSLADLGVRTFGDLRVDDEDSSLPPEQRYSLVVMASDVSRKRLVRWPWDYRLYGLDPDEQSVADAVRASASIPFFFEPVTLRSRDESGRTVVSTMVDGSVLSNFPVSLFDRSDGAPPRWPTSASGCRCAKRPGVDPRGAGHRLAGAVPGRDHARGLRRQHIDEPCVQVRSVFVDTSGVSPVDFGISEEQQELLLTAGRAAAVGFLQDWDFAGYLRSCRGIEEAL